MGHDARKPVFVACKQQTQTRLCIYSLISTFVILFLKSMMASLVRHNVAIFWLVTVAVHTFLSLTWQQTQKQGFSQWANYV